MTDANPTLKKRVKRQVSGKYRQCFVVTTPGMERLTAAELSALALSDPTLTIETGGIGLNTKLSDLMQANLHLRTANRLLMRLVTFKVENFIALRKKLAGIPWELFFFRNQKVDIRVTSRHSRLYHSKAVATRVNQSIVERQAFMLSGSPDLPDQTIFVRICNNRLTLSLDSSGEPLYKRGLKRHGGPAPLRETFAAAVLQMVKYDPSKPLLDPMCGVGSFSLEAAMTAKKMAAGLHRQFAFAGWPAFKPKQWAYLKKTAQKAVTSPARPTIFASDCSQKATTALSDCVKTHHLTDAIMVRKKNFFDLEPMDWTSEKGLVVLNPPYGIRLGKNYNNHKLLVKLVSKLKKKYRGWQVAMLIPKNAAKIMHPLALKSVQLIHGGLSVFIFHGKIR